MRDIALNIHLCPLALIGSGKSNMAEDARTDPLGDAMDYAPFACGVTAFEHHDDLGALGLDPLLHFDQLGLQLTQGALILFVAELGLLSRCSVSLVGLLGCLVLSQDAPPGSLPFSFKKR